MAIWKLTPLDLSDPNWISSSHRAIAIVRAADEAGARAVAEKAFGVPTHFKPGGGIHYPPWTRSALVKAELIEDPRYDPEGPSSVLEPSFG
jgi:hypothetical protein